MVAEVYNNVAAVQSAGWKEATPFGSKLGDVQFTSRQVTESTCDAYTDSSKSSTSDTSTESVEEELRLAMYRKLKCLEAEASAATKKELDLLEELYETKAQVLVKEGEVCDLQVQLAQELAEQQELHIKILEREKEICRLQKSSVNSQTLASNAGQNCDVSKTEGDVETAPNCLRRQHTPRVSWTPRDQFAKKNLLQNVRKVATAPATPRLQVKDLAASRSCHAPSGQLVRSPPLNFGTDVRPPWMSPPPLTGTGTLTTPRTVTPSSVTPRRFHHSGRRLATK
jgi:hypothetical protein